MSDPFFDGLLKEEKRSSMRGKSFLSLISGHFFVNLVFTVSFIALTGLGLLPIIKALNANAEHENKN